MKQVVLFLAVSVLMLMISCGDEQPTKVSEYVFDKRNIENDTNWVEFHDYDTLDGLCYNSHDVKGGILLNCVDEYKKVFLRAIDNRSFDSDYKCRSMKDSDFVAPDIDFNNRSLIIYSMTTQPLSCVRKIYYNKNTDEYFYLLEKPWGMDLHGLNYKEAISLPKISDNTKIMFDTIVRPIF